jgi:hypothetical protein
VHVNAGCFRQYPAVPATNQGLRAKLPSSASDIATGKPADPGRTEPERLVPVRAAGPRCDAEQVNTDIPERGQGTVRQYPIRPYSERLTLIPPLADPEHDLTGVEPLGFSVSGDHESNDRARQWALRHRYLLAHGITPCAHGLYMLSCPGYGCHQFGFDHTQVWVPAAAAQERPFILTQPYADEVPDRMQEYAAAHGLVLSTGLPGDDWYYPGHALPVRLTVPGSWPLWPIEEAAILLLATQPVNWPEDM